MPASAQGREPRQQVMVVVSRAADGYAYAAYGPGVDPDGTVHVRGRKGAPVRLAFVLAAGEGVDAVEFVPEAKRAIVVGVAGGEGCPEANGPEFDGHRPGRHRNEASVRDKLSVEGRFRYALSVLVTPEGGAEEGDVWDPMIANEPR